VRVFAKYSGDLVSLVRIWSRSWESRGWEPRLLSAKEIEEAGSVKRAIEARGGGRLTHLLVINFSHDPDGDSRGPVRIGRRRWKTAGLVRFPGGTTEADIIGCGRELILVCP